MSGKHPDIFCSSPLLHRWLQIFDGWNPSHEFTYMSGATGINIWPFINTFSGGILMTDLVRLHFDYGYEIDDVTKLSKSEGADLLAAAIRQKGDVYAEGFEPNTPNKVSALLLHLLCLNDATCMRAHTNNTTRSSHAPCSTHILQRPDDRPAMMPTAIDMEFQQAIKKARTNAQVTTPTPTPNKGGRNKGAK